MVYPPNHNNNPYNDAYQNPGSAQNASAYNYPGYGQMPQQYNQYGQPMPQVFETPQVTEKIKRSQIVLLATAAFFTVAKLYDLYNGWTFVRGEGGSYVPTLVGALVSVVIGLSFLVRCLG
ncbi:hypothetical protein [Rothia sp. ZJ932]|uniref:hypothetical protein n=1 Tax=Rothia sp. ZJ932 TaxID=2810516 RepID=UPI00196752C4|nr:hypothetical protein [Rothia sp. ZJ932]QRZ61059.1 hypothetical protein JR346_07295 [Rothia sp. ZJ932]